MNKSVDFLCHICCRCCHSKHTTNNDKTDKHQTDGLSSGCRRCKNTELSECEPWTLAARSRTPRCTSSWRFRSSESSSSRNFICAFTDVVVSYRASACKRHKTHTVRYLIQFQGTVSITSSAVTDWPHITLRVSATAEKTTLAADVPARYALCASSSGDLVMQVNVDESATGLSLSPHSGAWNRLPTAEATAVDQYFSSSTENFFVPFCLRTPGSRQMIVLWCTLCLQ